MTIKHIKRKFQTLLIGVFTLSSVLTTGCVYLVVGGIGALGGYVISPDTVEGIAAVDEMELWDTSVEILSIMGTVTETQEEGGIILATVAGSKVSVVILPHDEELMKIRIKARKNYIPKISTAQEVYIKIMSEVTDY